MKTVLFIVTEINSANGICSESVMNKLSSEGYRVLCLSNEEPGLPKGYYSKNDISYYTVRPRLVYRLESYINTLGCGFKKSALACVTALINKFKLALSIPMWPLISPLYSYRVYKSAKNICETENVDILVPVFTKVDALIAAEKIKRKNTNLQYIPYFLDSMSGGYGPRVFSKEWTIKRGLKWERRLLKSADKIFLMKSSEEHHKKYSASEDYYKKMVFLDLPLFNPKSRRDNALNKENGAAIELLFVGSIPVQVRNPEKFFKVFKNIKGEKYKLTIIGTNNCPDIMNKALKADERINIGPFVSHDEAMKLLSSADFLINFGNNDPSMTPSKIFEYMSTGTPIISTAPIKDEPSIPYLQKYPLCCILDECCSDTAKMAEKLGSFLQEAYGKRVETDILEVAFYLNTPQAFVEQLEK